MKIRDLQRLTDDVLIKHGNIEIQIFDDISRSWKGGINSGVNQSFLPIPPVLRLWHGREPASRVTVVDREFEGGEKDYQSINRFQRACNQAESDLKAEETKQQIDLAAEYRRFWDEVVIHSLHLSPVKTSEDAAWSANFADRLTEQRCQRFGTSDAPQCFNRKCICGNRLVCDQCHCLPETCKCKEGYTGI